MVNKVLVIGGTGFIGYHVVKKLRQYGINVGVVSRKGVADRLRFSSDVRSKVMDVKICSENELTSTLKGYDSFVFAAGADDAKPIKSDPRQHFSDANVLATRKVIEAAKNAGLARGVVLGSYFTYFAREQPELRLAETHPYIWSRVEQQKQGLEAASDCLDLKILELPYIFGRSPGRTPLWAPLVGYLGSHWPLLVPDGGTNCIAVKDVADAIVGALKKPGGERIYTIGDENLRWTELVITLSSCMDRKRKAKVVPNFMTEGFLRAAHLQRRLCGQAGGLDLRLFRKVLTMEAFFDPRPSQLSLGYSGGGLEDAFRDTVAACEECSGGS